MRKFTKLFCTAFLLLAGFVSASAQDALEVEGEKVEASFEQPTGIDWDSENKIFSWSSQYGNQLKNIGLPTGNLSEYVQLVVDCEVIEGDGYRFMFYSYDNFGTTAGGITIVEKANAQPGNSKRVYNLADFQMDSKYITECSEICLSGWNPSGKVKVNSVYLIKSSNPLAGFKKQLSDALTAAKAKNAYGKTTASWSALTQAIAAGETALAAEDATQESLEAATQAINDAISGLALKDGFSNISTDMFHAWTSPNADATVTEDAVYPANELGKSVGQGTTIWGDPSVRYIQYADLTNYEQLVITGTPGFVARLCLNRAEPVEGGDANGGALIEIVEPLNEDGVLVIDLKNHEKLQGAEYIHLNSFKTPWNGMSGVFNEILLYKTSVYTVAGTADLTGYEWDTTQNIMTLDEETGLYTWTAENITVSNEAQPMFKVVKNGTEWFPASEEGDDHNWVITPDYLGGEGVYTITITFDAETQNIDVKGVKAYVEPTYPEGAIVFNYRAEGRAHEEAETKLTKVKVNFQVNMGEGKEDRTDRNFCAYTNEDGSFANLPATCQVSIGEENKVDKDGLIVSQDRYLSVYGLNTGDKVIIYYIGVPEGKTPTYCPGTSVDTEAAINGQALVSAESAINSGDEIEITKAGEKNYIIMSIFKGMRIQQVVIVPAPVVEEDVYTVAGSPALTGYQWDTTQNVMTLNEESGLYTWTRENVEVTSEAELKFKVVMNGSWDTAWPESDWVITPELFEGGEGIYTITITFNAETKEIGVSGEKTGEIVAPEPEVKLYVIGTANNWDRANMTELTFDQAANAFKYEINATGDFYFAFANYQPTEEELANDGDWSVFNSTYRFAIAAGDQDAELDKEYELVKVNGTIKLAQGKYNVYVTKDFKMTIKDATTDGINFVTIDTRNAVIYNMNGQRVMNAQKGLFIVNGKKVVIK